MLKYSEACLLSGTWLVVSGNQTSGWAFICLSMVFVFARTSLHFHKINQEKEEKEEIIKVGSKIIDGLVSQFGLVLSGTKSDEHIH